MPAPDWNQTAPLPEGEAISRKIKQSEYHVARMKGLDEMDKLASPILAASFSVSSDPTNERQKWVQQSCVAVCRGGSEFLVAVNYLSAKRLLDEQVVSTVSTLSGVHGVNLAGGNCRVLAGNDAKHAEMKIVEALLSRHGGDRKRLAGLMVGVSKPCCPKCSNVLAGLGMRFSYLHNDQPTNWEAPEGVA